jgi:MobA/MobL family
MLDTVQDDRARAVHALAKPEFAPVTITPVMHRDPNNPEREERRRTYLTAVANYLYIFRLGGSDHLGVLPDNYLQKADDFVVGGRRRPRKVPLHLHDGSALWEEADAATSQDLADAAAIHVILTLPDLPRYRWKSLVERFIDDNLIALGIIADWAIHAKSDDSGEGWLTHPHVHLLCTARRWKSDQQKGRRMRPWLCSKAQNDALENAWLALTGLAPSTFTVG